MKKKKELDNKVKKITENNFVLTPEMLTNTLSNIVSTFTERTPHNFVYFISVQILIGWIFFNLKNLKKLGFHLLKGSIINELQPSEKIITYIFEEQVALSRIQQIVTFFGNFFSASAAKGD